MKKFALGFIILIGAIALADYVFMGKDASVKPIENLKVRFYMGDTLPDPADIKATVSWYMLTHISSGLVAYDSNQGRFSNFLGKGWKIEDNGNYTFEIADDAKFHDGTPILATDVEASIKRILIKKSSTHFHLWEYLEGCDQLKTMADTCSGLKVLSDRVIRFQLKFRVTSFLLQLATPETGIWSKNDIDPKTLEIKPTKFSGPYYVSGIDEGAFHLKINPYNPIYKKFPLAARSIDAVRLSYKDAEEKLMKHEIDALVRGQKPLGEKPWAEADVKMIKSAPSAIIYLNSLDSKNSGPKIGKDFVQAMWKIAEKGEVLPALSVLPFKENYTISSDTVLANLPATSVSKIRVATPGSGFFSESFLNLLKSTAQTVGVDMEFESVPMEQYFEFFKEAPKNSKFDYVLGLYDASERFPAVQLRFITGVRNVTAPVDLKLADVPDMGEKETAILKTYQEWLIRQGFVVPMFFNRTVIIHKNSITMGAQTFSDGEIELWKFQPAAVVK